MRYPNDKEKEINAVELRKACKCASCIDEFTDKPLLNKDKVEYINFFTVMKCTPIRSKQKVTIQYILHGVNVYNLGDGH